MSLPKLQTNAFIAMREALIAAGHIVMEADERVAEEHRRNGHPKAERTTAIVLCRIHKALELAKEEAVKEIEERVTS